VDNSLETESPPWPLQTNNAPTPHPAAPGLVVSVPGLNLQSPSCKPKSCVPSSYRWASPLCGSGWESVFLRPYSRRFWSTAPMGS
jgi:hypothetical protein